MGGEEFRGIRNWKFVMDARNSDVSAGWSLVGQDCCTPPQENTCEWPAIRSVSTTPGWRSSIGERDGSTRPFDSTVQLARFLKAIREGGKKKNRFKHHRRRITRSEKHRPTQVRRSWISASKWEFPKFSKSQLPTKSASARKRIRRKCLALAHCFIANYFPAFSYAIDEPCVVI